MCEVNIGKKPFYVCRKNAPCSKFFLNNAPSSDRKKSTLSVWKIIAFYPNKQFWPNKLIKLRRKNAPFSEFKKILPSTGIKYTSYLFENDNFLSQHANLTKYVQQTWAYHYFLGPNATSEQRPPVNNGHIFGVSRVVVVQKFNCILIKLKLSNHDET